jgi:pilus assembly protein Flp/PilA
MAFWNHLKMRRLIRFGRNERGATAIEFGFLAAPFIMMMTMTVETALVFWTRQALQESVAQTSRLVMTGEARTLFGTNPSTARIAFITAICDRMRINSAADCANRITVDVQVLTSFPASIDSMVSSGTIDPTSFAYRNVGPNQIAVVRTVYKFPVFFAGYFGALSRLTTGENAIETVVAFRAEPFPP